MCSPKSPIHFHWHPPKWTWCCCSLHRCALWKFPVPVFWFSPFAHLPLKTVISTENNLSHYQFSKRFLTRSILTLNYFHASFADSHHSLMSLTWGAVTADGADVFGEWQSCARGLGRHLHHAVEAQWRLYVLRTADRVHWRVQLEHQHTETHTPTSHNAAR